MDKVAIRRAMRKQRRALSPCQQKSAAKNLARHLSLSTLLKFHKRWALYLASDGEISPDIWSHKLARRKRIQYLPVLHPIYHNRLWFLQLDESTRLRKNKYGIYEPDPRTCKRIPVWAIGVICFPLVAFDQAGHRLGMGGGYYDRSFAAIRTRIRCPKLVGLAHSFQQHTGLPAEAWDIPMQAVVTEKHLFEFKLV